MPAEFRPHYPDSCLVGFGAIFDRDLPQRAFDRFLNYYEGTVDERLFWRTCDVVFSTLTPRILVDVPKENLPWATDESRMYRTPGHVEERAEMLRLARLVRDA